MIWFKNLTPYKLTKQIDFSKLEEQLQETKFTPCALTDLSKFGFDAPLSTSDSLCYRQGDNILLVAHLEKKHIPNAVLKKETDTRITELQEKEKRYLKKVEKQAVKDQVMSELLQRAFSKHSFVSIWIDTANDLIYTDVSSFKRSEDTLVLLRKTIGSLPVVPLNCNVERATAMTKWIADNSTPEWLSVLYSGKLVDFETNAEISCKEKDFNDEEVLSLIENGSSVTELALEREDMLKFKLIDDGRLKQIKFVEDIIERNDDILKDDVAQRFDADFLLITNILTETMLKLIDEFGGVRN